MSRKANPEQILDWALVTGTPYRLSVREAWDAFWRIYRVCREHPHWDNLRYWLMIANRRWYGWVISMNDSVPRDYLTEPVKAPKFLRWHLLASLRSSRLRREGKYPATDLIVQRCERVCSQRFEERRERAQKQMGGVPS